MSYCPRFNIDSSVKDELRKHEGELLPCPICNKAVAFSFERDAEGDEEAVIRCCICRVGAFGSTLPAKEQAAYFIKVLITWWNTRGMNTEL